MTTRLTAATLATLTLLAILAIAPETAAAQCAMCRTALEQNPEAAAGFNRGILFLLVMPYLLFAIGAAVVLRHHRAKTKANASQPIPAPRPHAATDFATAQS